MTLSFLRNLKFKYESKINKQLYVISTIRRVDGGCYGIYRRVNSSVQEYQRKHYEELSFIYLTHIY